MRGVKARGEAPFPRVALALAKLLRTAPQNPDTREESLPCPWTRSPAESLDFLGMTRVPKKDDVPPLSKLVVDVSGNVHEELIM